MNFSLKNIKFIFGKSWHNKNFELIFNLIGWILILLVILAFFVNQNVLLMKVIFFSYISLFYLFFSSDGDRYNTKIQISKKNTRK